MTGRFHKPINLIGPFDRDQSAHWDETNGVAAFCAGQTGTMIDVGAHHGSAMLPFLDMGWDVFAFEPDSNNRSKLLERIDKYKSHVAVDSRCVSNQSQTGVSFFASDQSTGISGLSAFHESHRESNKVDIITLTEFFQDKSMPTVDFLKIDTEGHDLFVLQGYPWDRGKPTVIECEFEDNKTIPLGYTFHDLAKYLEAKGYQVFVSEWHPIIRYGVRHDWRALMRYPCELADSKGWGNLLAFRDPIEDQKLVAVVEKLLRLSARVPTSPVAIGKPNFSINADSNYTAVAPNQWRYKHSEAKQKLWVAVAAQPIAAGQVVVGSLRIQVDRALTAMISLGRQGSTKYEGTSQRVRLRPGQSQAYHLHKAFDYSHAALKLQIEVVTLSEGDSATLTITDLHLAEAAQNVSNLNKEKEGKAPVRNDVIQQLKEQNAKKHNMLLNRDRTIQELKEKYEKERVKLDNRDKAILEQKEKYAKEHVKVLNRDKAIIDLKSKVQLREIEAQRLREELEKLRQLLPSS